METKAGRQILETYAEIFKIVMLGNHSNIKIVDVPAFPGAGKCGSAL